MARKVILVNVAELHPHPRNAPIYGNPKSTKAYADMVADMKDRGFSDRYPLLITADRIIIGGVTRWLCAKAAKITQVPCEIFVPSAADPILAELEIREQIPLDNGYREKTQLMVARELAMLAEIEKERGRRRMALGSDDGPSKATDRVAQAVKRISGKTVQRRLKILKAIDEAHDNGDHRKADQLTELLEQRKTLQALAVIKGKALKPKKAVKVEVRRTLHDHATKAYSEFYEACCKATVGAELDVLEAHVQRVLEDIQTARKRLEG
jgi:hypothetical protein